MSISGDIRVVVGIDFGTTYSGFSYTHISHPIIITNEEWPEKIGQLKTNTVLKYKDENFEEVDCWGYPALYKSPIELFKLHLGDIPESEKPYLPSKLSYKKAITDYLREIAEAAAIYCIDKIPETEIDNYIGRSFLVVDCGGGTVDLTIRKLLKKDELDEVTIRTGDYCGGTCVDQEFIKFLESKVGELAISRLIENHYGKYQYLIQEFCRIVKLSFTGIEEEYKNYELDIEQDCPILKQYITGSKKNRLEDDDWLIGLGFDDVKNMFDPVIIGGFSESKYLQERIRKEFMVRVDNIIIPHQPIAAVVRGAVRYGTNKKLIKNRVLKYTYGRSTLRPYNESIDTLDRKRDSGYVLVFKPLARKGTTVEVGQKFFQTSHPENSDQEKMWCRILITDNESARYCDDDGVKELGDFIIDLPDKQLGKDRKVYFELCFGEMEIRAYAKNEYNGNEYSATFNYFDENIAKVADEKFS
ncbi:unnamed protein product [Rhizophagus irregularis]|nr:unnamed protein product [Rhizophagus irregularis]